MTSFPVAFDPSSLPSHWRFARLRTLATHLSRGGAPKYSDEPTELSVVNQKCIHWDGFHPEHVKFHVPVADPTGLKGYLHAGDLLVNSTGEGTVGRCVVFVGGENHVADGHVTAIRFRPSEMDARYVAYVLNTGAFQEYLDAWFILGATKQVELTAGRFKNAMLAVPPLEEQRNIVAFLQVREHRLRELERLVGGLGAFKVGRAGLVAERYDALVTSAVLGQLDIARVQDQEGLVVA